MDNVSMPTLLVVDDNSMNLRIAAFALKPKYNVLTVESGQGALDILSTTKVHAILLDVNMPGMDGFETFEKIRQIEGCENTPICFLTADTDRDCLYRIDQLNVPLIQKPIDPTTITNTIEGLM